MTQDKLDELRAGVTVGGIHYGPIEAAIERVQGSNLWLTFAIREGKNREVRNVLGELGLEVTRLIRISFGPFQLSELAEGAAEEVRTRVLREQLGERLAALSGADFSAPVTDAPPPQKRDDPRKSARPQPTSRSQHAHEEDDPKKLRHKFHGARRGDDKERERRTATGANFSAPVAASPMPQKRGDPRKGARPKPTSHTWRTREEDDPKKLRRKFHGSRRDDEKGREQRAAEARIGEVTDRKGRRVHVERFGQPPPRQQPKEEAPNRRRRSRRFSPDRASGPRPRQPRGRR